MESGLTLVHCAVSLSRLTTDCLGRLRATGGEEIFVSNEIFVAVVDDDEPFRTALVESLGSFGYVARGFASAKEFMASGAEKMCDSVVTDIHMPGMSGFDLLHLLKSRASKLPVIMITAHAEPGLEAKATAAGAVCLLRKPFESSSLISCLASALRSR
jgi:FixJ family two-component response regulator